MKTIALFGGSFDPPHIGHEAIIKALDKLDFLDKVVVMPTFLNPFKERFFAPAELRLLWLEKICTDLKKVTVSDYEVKQAKKVSSIQTVKHLLNRYKKIYLVIGADNLKNIKKWHKFDELNKLVTFIIVTRDDIDIKNSFLTIDIKEDISSSSLRENIDEEKLPSVVKKEILKYYKEKNEQQN
jgi:nicotinate-nucleotide adenylyltransferase